jgi:PEP-CTERM motif
MRYCVCSLAVAAGLIASPAFASVNLIKNGDFTLLTSGLGQITAGAGITTALDWTTTGYSIVEHIANVPVRTQYAATPDFTLWDKANGGASTWNGMAPIGNFLAMAADFRTEEVSQTVSGLTLGKTYVLDFDYAFAQQRSLNGLLYNGPTTQMLTAWDGATKIFTSPTEHLANHGFAGWDAESLRFTATSNVISFLASGSPAVPPFTLVSDVSLTAVPEPATWAMMLLGFAGLGYAGFRSTRGKAAII